MNDVKQADHLTLWDDQDVVLAESIFGTADRSTVAGMIAAWIDRHAGERFGHIVSMEMSVGAAIAVALAGGSLRFLKVWPATTDEAGLAAQLHVQAALARQGYPAPAVLTGPVPL